MSSLPAFEMLSGLPEKCQNADLISQSVIYKILIVLKCMATSSAVGILVFLAYSYPKSSGEEETHTTSQSASEGRTKRRREGRNRASRTHHSGCVQHARVPLSLIGWLASSGDSKLELR
ncbi:hypothetical protein Ddc_17890 [Ditylenchus destructor]|nr:hypothetical protein Ddc_17890 [Ditylenchus destructor]